MDKTEETLVRLNTILNKGDEQIIQNQYKEVIIETFKEMMPVITELDNNTMSEMLNIIEDVINRSLELKTDFAKIAAFLMLRITDAQYLTTAHINILLTIISLSFKHGNQILYNITKYNSYINDLCLEKMNILSSLADIRRTAVTDTYKRQADLNTVATLIKRQFVAL